jgi:NAD(P)-dependent dehydrogenase (short-subunit alcohol dehydrogenase family)
MKPDIETLFDLTGRVAVVTGGAGMLGQRHAEAIAAAGGTPVIVDLAVADPVEKARRIGDRYGVPALGTNADVTDALQVKHLLATVLDEFGSVDILINNAANNPKVDASTVPNWSRLEQFPLELWNADIAVGLTGAFLCSQVIGTEMARRKKGVILNVASDLAVIAPDQRLYRQPELKEDEQPVKPITYSVVKTGMLGLTRYLATYWAQDGVRVNAISPGGVFAGQDEEFVTRLTKLIPLGRMANQDEYKGAIVFLCSDASAYRTGANVVIDGGRTTW